MLLAPWVSRFPGPIVLIAAAACLATASPAAGRAAVALPGHVPSALAHATPVAEPPTPDEAVTVTVVLRRDDEAGFQRLRAGLQTPGHPDYRHFLSAAEQADRFGPGPDVRRQVLRFLESQGLDVLEGSDHALAITARGPRAAVEEAFGVRLASWSDAHRTFEANTTDPVLPSDIATHVQAVIGLSSLAEPRPMSKAIRRAANVPNCWLQAQLAASILSQRQGESPEAFEARRKSCADTVYNRCLDKAEAGDNGGNNGSSNASSTPASCVQGSNKRLVADRARSDSRLASTPLWSEVDGSGQTIGIIGFDNFFESDVRDYLELIGADPSRIDRLSSVAVGGGTAPGPDQAEVLLDIADVMLLAPGADVVVFHAPFAGRGVSFQALLSAAIDDGVDIITNSWAYCESQTTQADVDSIESILQTAAVAGISVFSATGDSGSTCLDGSADTAAVPASAPSLVAVGGSSLELGPAQTWRSESWWDGTADTPSTGQGGFARSRFFERPSWQDDHHGSPMRSIPDVVANADPARGIMLCQASGGGCPTGLLYGGTSRAAPTWAAWTALLNQWIGTNLGEAAPLFYALADTDGFHDAAELASDYDHVGLGSANLSVLARELTDTEVTAVSASLSEVAIDASVFPPLAGVPADGTAASVVVRLRDQNGHTVDGHTVTLAADPSEDVVVAAVDATTSVANGAAFFEVTSMVPGAVTLTATDTTEGVVVQQTVELTFVVPTAAAASIAAFPTDVAANGTSQTTVTVTLKDSLDRPAPGKTVRLDQGAGHSRIAGPVPAVTDAAGQIQFTATNLVAETVTYTAVDVSDGELDVPGSAEVTFSGATASCVDTTPPAGEGDLVVTPFATGFVAENFFFGGVNWGGCPGAVGPVFLGNDVYVFGFRNGGVYRFDPSGGAASSANLLAELGPTLGFPAVGKDGRLYATFGAGAGGASSGSVVELDPQTGQVLRTLSSDQKCPSGLAVDPLSGDLFFAHQCFGAGTNDASLHRIVDPAGDTPTTELYATMPTSPNGVVAFAPDGTIYVAVGYSTGNPQVVRVDGTDQPFPPSVTVVADVPVFYAIAIGSADENGAATSIIGPTTDALESFDITQMPPERTQLAIGVGPGTIGPDGCIYSARQDTVYKVGGSDGTCNFLATGAAPRIALSPASLDPDPLQGDEQEFTARLLNVDAPEGTAVHFFVDGANRQLVLAAADAQGTATLRLRGVHTGRDTIDATAQAGDVALRSNRARINWAADRHVADVSLNPSPVVTSARKRTTVAASLTDISEQPVAALVGHEIDFTLDTGACSATTDGDGIATCELLAANPGHQVLTASFDGDENLVGSMASIGVQVICGACGDANTDGNITATDALVALRTSIALEQCPTCICDANGNAAINATDALVLLRVAVGLPDPLACPAI